MKKILFKILRLKKLVSYEIKHKAKVKKRYSFYRKGFLSSNVINYDLLNNSYTDYLSDYDRFLKAHYINNGKDNIINEKILFHNYFKDNSLVVKPIGYIFNRKLLDFETNLPISSSDFLKKQQEDIIVKPSTGGGGGGIVKLKIQDRIDIATEKQLNQLTHNNTNYVIQKFISQTGFCREVFSNSINTIRILAVKDSSTESFFIAKAVQRFGTDDSVPADNWTAGGISVDIDLNSGVYKKGAIKPLKGEKSIKWLSHHPNSNVKFEGEKILLWENMKEKILKLSNELFFLNYIGWDVNPMEDGFLVLEANSNSDVNLLQIHGGLLKDQRVKDFYIKHNIL